MCWYILIWLCKSSFYPLYSIISWISFFPIEFYRRNLKHCVLKHRCPFLFIPNFVNNVVSLSYYYDTDLCIRTITRLRHGCTKLVEVTAYDMCSYMKYICWTHKQIPHNNALLWHQYFSLSAILSSRYPSHGSCLLHRSGFIISTP